VAFEVDQLIPRESPTSLFAVDPVTAGIVNFTALHEPLPPVVQITQPPSNAPHVGQAFQPDIVKKLFALLAQAHHRLGQPNQALAMCRAGRARNPEDPELLYLEGVFHRERKGWSAAERSLRALIRTEEKIHHRDTESTKEKREEMNRRERGENAEKAIQKENSLESSPLPSVSSAFSAVKNSYKINRGERGEGAEQTIQEREHSAEASPLPSVSSAFSAVKNSSFGSADVGLNGYLARHQLALLYYQQGRLAEAEAEWKLALADRPGYLDALKGLGEMYLKQGRWPELDAVVERLIEEKTNSHGLHGSHGYEGQILQARGMLARKEFEAARSILEPMVEAQPGSVYPRIILSHVYLQDRKDFESAERVLREVVQLDATQAESWRNLAVLLREQGRLDEAAEACRTGWRLNPNYPTLPLLLGITLADQGNFAGAEMCFLRLLELPYEGPVPPEHIEARHQLALIYQKTGHPAEAEAQWRTILAERPDYAPAVQAVKQSPTSNGILHHGSQEVPANGTPSSAAKELASIIILCCNQLEYTRQCLESVLSYTRHPHELILVDNGSTDGTREYLDGFRSRVAPIRVEIIRNETNVGYPAGCNQALARCKGRYLVFLNNDTIVTEGWLDGLIAWTLHGKVGLVGPLTNRASGPQQIPTDYQDLRNLPAWAARLRQQNAGQAARVDRLTGFCLLVCREVFDQVGTFDEQFGLGFFDDDDLCVRAREAGFGLVVAQHVFVHHFGNRTFHGLGIDCRQLLMSNFERFKSKWGSERAAGYRLVGENH
jgi:GT2 family glycosyltransferase/Tfp pilus assembly protein PilF